MIEVQTEINGRTISITKIINTDEKRGGKTIYEVIVHDLETDTIHRGEILHRRKAGLNALVSKAFDLLGNPEAV